MSDYQIERLGNTLFALRPEYDATVQELGGEPPLGVPGECTFEWAWAKATETVNKQNRIAQTKARLAAKRAERAEATATPPRKTPARKAPPRRTAPRKGSPNK